MRSPLALVALFFAACSTQVELSPSEVCDNVGYAIASRTLDCTSSATLANARYDAFTATMKCGATKALTADFACSYAVGTASCSEVLALRDDFSAWLARSSTCAHLFPSGGRP
jgi:hypothetical protein